MIESILKNILSGKDLEIEEARGLFDLKKADILSLMRAADIVRREFCGNKMDLCSLISAKSGLCPEDCAFCAQSGRHDTGCKVYPLVRIEKIVSAARQAKKHGATNFCIVISGESPTKEEFQKIKTAIEQINKTVGIKVDCSLGRLEIGMIRELKALGIDRFNHNLETSKEFYTNICTTHSYDSRLGMVGMLKEVGIKPCCGGIIGLGEGPEEKMNLAFTLKKMNIDCVPINILDPRKGTPLENINPIEPLDAIRTIAVFRLILPKAIIKVAGGRESGLRDLQAMAFMAGANGMIIGGYLTTAGRSVDKDLEMIKDLGFEL
jgi:biotin synthase